MVFDITQLDKTLLIQTLFAHSSPINYGCLEYNYRKKLGDNVDGLSEKECEDILYVYNHTEAEYYYILDYHKGKPMKLNFKKNKNGRVIVSSESYDERNGKYRFFEALLNIFSLDEIFIIKKGYKDFDLLEIPEELIRNKNDEKIFKNILKNTIEIKNTYGKVWTIDESKVSYIPPFMK